MTGARWAWTGLAAAALLLGACDEGEGEDRPGVDVIGGAGSVSASGAVEGYGAPLYEPSTDQALNLAIGLDLKAMRALLAPAIAGDEVDWAAAEALYEEGENQVLGGGVRSLRDLALAARTDAFPNAVAVYGSGTFIDSTVMDGLTGEGRAAGLGDNARRQMVDKGIQVLMYGEAMARLNDAEAALARGDQRAAATAIDEAWAILSGARDETGSPNNGLLATALGREDDYTLQGKIARPLEGSLFAALAAAQQGDEPRFAAELDEVRGYLNTTFYLSTLRYAPVLTRDTRSSDRAAHLAEAWTFFQGIRAQVQAASPGAAEVIEEAYRRSGEEPFPDDVAAAVFDRLNEPAVLDALGIPAEFRAPAP